MTSLAKRLLNFQKRIMTKDRPHEILENAQKEQVVTALKGFLGLVLAILAV